MSRPCAWCDRVDDEEVLTITGCRHAWHRECLRKFSKFYCCHTNMQYKDYVWATTDPNSNVPCYRPTPINNYTSYSPPPTEHLDLIACPTTPPTNHCGYCCEGNGTGILARCKHHWHWTCFFKYNEIVYKINPLHDFCKCWCGSFVTKEEDAKLTQLYEQII